MLAGRSTSPSVSEPRRDGVGPALAFFVGLVVFVSTAKAGAEGRTQTCVRTANAAQKVRDEGRLLEARELFLTCAAPSCPALVREDCARWAEETAARTPSVVLGARNTEGSDLVHVRVLVDGRPFATELDGRPRPLDPGPHTLTFEAEGGGTARVDLVLRAGEGPRVVVPTLVRAEAPAPEPPATAAATAAPRGGTTSPWPWVFGGITVASAAATTGLALHANALASDLETQCAPRCGDADTAAMRTELVLANVALGVAVAAAAGFVYFTWIRPHAATKSAVGMPAVVRF